MDRTIATLKSAGIRHALVNAGGSSITPIGAPTGKGMVSHRRRPQILLLRDSSMSTSQQNGEIVDVLVVLNQPESSQVSALSEFEKKGGRVVDMLKGVKDPNALALEVRRISAASWCDESCPASAYRTRVIDGWNGTTVLTAPYEEPDGGPVMVTVLNMRNSRCPCRCASRKSCRPVQYESPEESAGLVSYRRLAGYSALTLRARRMADGSS
jgi:hypothetical protein